MEIQATCKLLYIGNPYIVIVIDHMYLHTYLFIHALTISYLAIIMYFHGTSGKHMVLLFVSFYTGILSLRYILLAKLA